MTFSQVNDNERPPQDDPGNDELSLEEKVFSLLSEFHFTNTTSLRQFIRQTGMIISGSAALALIHPIKFIPNDIDFYTLPNTFASVLKYIENHGYEIVPYDHATMDYFHQNIIVVGMTHPVSGKKVNVSTSLDNHVVKAITRFHSTIVMNYLSWFALVILYPEWTLQKHGLITTNIPTSHQSWLTKYIDRGYTLHDDVLELRQPTETHTCGIDPYCQSSTRSLHDGHCVVQTFESTPFESDTNEPDMTWKLSVPCSFEDLSPAPQN